MQHCYSATERTRYSVIVSWLISVIMIVSGPSALAQRKPIDWFDQLPSATTKAQEPARQADNRLVINADMVSLRVSVADSGGHYVPGLRPRDFMLTDSQVPQQITFFSDEDLPASIAVVFDVSGSMRGGRIARAAEALANFVQTSDKDDEYSMIAFNSRPQLLLDRSRDGNALIGSLSGVKADGDTALFDATYLALDRIALGMYKKRAVLIISDGEDNDSRHTLSQLRRFLQESDATIYAIDVNATPLPKELYGRLVLDELAAKSGGRMFWPKNTAEMIEVFDQIALELRHQYTIGYAPSNFVADGKWHRLRLKVTPPPGLKRVIVRAREGYYAVQSSR